MKKILLLVIYQVLFSHAPVAAQTQPVYSSSVKYHTITLNSLFKDTVPAKEMYLQRSRTQRTVGWAMLGGGVLLTVAGGAIFANNFELFKSANDDKAAAGGVMMLAGIGCTLGSIPLFISSAHNARKAAAISFKPQQLLLPVKNDLVSTAQPAIHITVRL